MSNEEHVTERVRNLPDGAEIDRLRKSPNPDDNGRLYTFAAIGKRYNGVSRQAVHKAWLKWKNKQEQEQVTS